MTVKGFRDSFRSYTVVWLQNRLGSDGTPLNVGYRMLYAMIFPLDVAVQAIVEGLRAAWPGPGTPTALPLVAQSRGLLQGEAESDPAFALRCIPWLSTWEQADSYANEQLARSIQDYLGNTPMVRVVDRRGQWTTVDASGNASETTAAWDWDSASNPERATIWSDLWIIVYPCEWTQAPMFAARRLQPHDQGYGIGCLVQRTASDAILSLVKLWKDAHTSVQAIIFSYDATLCVPGGMNNPDGTWGHWSKPSGGPSGTRIPSRSANARYCIPRTF